jgi:ssDNA-binding Zn-finger/Zn-ribbon topoisomerase 1
VTKRYTEDDWISLAKERHGDRYRYAGCGYKGMAEKVTIVCPRHGPFDQRAQAHILGRGCQICGREDSQKSQAQSAAKRRLTTAELVERFKKAHGALYDYGQVQAHGTKSPVTIVCREHGPFRQLPNNHLRGSGCPECGTLVAASKHRLTQDEFERRARAAHGARYDLSSAVYETQYDKVIVGCAEHGNFQILPYNLWNGGGCALCALQENGLAHRVTPEIYKTRIAEVHGERYDHSRIQYRRMHDPITVLCPRHGPFSPSAVNYLMGRGCPKCGGESAAKVRTPKLVLSADEVLSRFCAVHGDRYDYSATKYEHSNRHIEIVCNQHGAFRQTPRNHWLGKGCPACGREALLEAAAQRVLTTTEIVRRFRLLHGDRYDYAETNYHRFTQPVKIRCHMHGVFQQKPQAHLEGKGCPQCSQSSGEVRAAAWLRSKNIDFKVEFPVRISDPNGQTRWGRFDFFLPELGVFVEIDGPHHFAPVRYAGMSAEDALRVHEATLRRDEIKDKWAESCGFAVLRVRWDREIEEALQQLSLNETR